MPRTGRAPSLILGVPITLTMEGHYRWDVADLHFLGRGIRAALVLSIIGDGATTPLYAGPLEQAVALSLHYSANELRERVCGYLYWLDGAYGITGAVPAPAAETRPITDAYGGRLPPREVD